MKLQIQLIYQNKLQLEIIYLWRSQKFINKKI
jgi:hypothetical protein